MGTGQQHTLEKKLNSKDWLLRQDLLSKLGVWGSQERVEEERGGREVSRKNVYLIKNNLKRQILGFSHKSEQLPFERPTQSEKSKVRFICYKPVLIPDLGKHQQPF